MISLRVTEYENVAKKTKQPINESHDPRGSDRSSFLVTDPIEESFDVGPPMPLVSDYSIKQDEMIREALLKKQSLC
jgi:hypothetical protein